MIVPHNTKPHIYTCQLEQGFMSRKSAKSALMLTF